MDCAINGVYGLIEEGVSKLLLFLMEQCRKNLIDDCHLSESVEEGE